MPGFVVGTQILLTMAAMLFAADDRSSSRFDELLARQDFSAAEHWCQERLASSTISPVELVRHTVSLIHCRSEWAVQTQGDKRQQHWDDARTAAHTFLEKHPDHPRRLLVQVQDALTVLSLGTQLRREAELQGLDNTAYDAARLRLREALELLQKLDRTLTSDLALARRGKRVTERLTADELMSLQYNLWGKLAEARRNQGLTYPPDSPDRLAALNDGALFARRALAQVAKSEPLFLDVSIELSTCLRVLGDADSAHTLIGTLDSRKYPETARAALLAEQIRVLIQRRQLEAASELFAKQERKHFASNPQLDTAELELLLANWKTSIEQKDENRAQQWSVQSARIVDHIRQAHGTYWGQLAERQLLLTARGLNVSGDWDILRREALDAFHQGKLDDAVNLFDQASLLASRRRNLEASFDMAYQSALILQKQLRHQEVAQRLSSLVLQQPASKKSPPAHLVALWHASQVAKASPDQVLEYHKMLMQHLEIWPDDPTSHTVRYWLGLLHSHAGEWTAAVSRLQAISPDAADFPAAVKLLELCFSKQLAECESNKEATDGIMTRAEQYVGLVLGLTNLAPESETEIKGRAILFLARVRIQFAREKLADSVRQLEAALNNSALNNTAVDRNLRDELGRMTILSLGLQTERRDLALQKLGELTTHQPVFLTASVSDLMKASQRASGKEQREIAAFMVQLIDKCRHLMDDLSEPERIHVIHARVMALANSGRVETAIKEMESLAATNSQSAPIQADYGELLLRSKDPKLLEKALGQWRIIASRSQPRSDQWYRSKYFIAYTLVRLERRTEAEKLVRYLEATDGLGPSPWNEKLRELGKR